MSYIETMLRKQAALALKLTQDGETAMTLAQMAVVATGGQERELEGEPGAQAGAAGGAADGTAAGGQDGAAREHGAAALWQSYTALAGQNERAAALGRQVMERESARVRQNQSVILQDRTPQSAPGGLTGSYAQTLTVAGLASNSTARSMEEISRFFERDARRYGA